MTTSNATLSGAVKYVLESAGLGLSVFRDVAPPKAHLPFAVVTEGVSRTPLPSGDVGATNELVLREQYQVDVWQALRSANGDRTENYDLFTHVAILLHNTKLPTWIHHVYGCRVLNVVSSLGTPDLRRDVLTVQVNRRFTA